MISVTLHVEPESGGAVAINGAVGSSYPYDRSYRKGATVKLEARPAEGYEFTGWGGDVSGSQNPKSIELASSVSVTALFSSATHTITVTADGNGSVTPDIGDHDYSENKVVSLTASADEGWQFDGWSGDVSDPASLTTTVTADSDKKVTANFSPVMRTLTVNSSFGGEPPLTVNTYQYAADTTVDVAASEQEGWQFSGWAGDVADASAANTKVLMDGDKTVTANFSRIMRTLTVNSSYGGEAPLTVDTHQYAEGTTVDVAATVQNDWTFSGWTGDVVDPASVTTKVVMDSDKTVTANFSSAGAPAASPAPSVPPPAPPEAAPVASSTVGVGVLVPISVAAFLAIFLPITLRKKRIRETKASGDTSE